MAFDVDGARKAGYSDTEIADHMAGESKFNAVQARNAGYSDTDIIGHLTAKPPTPAPAPKLTPGNTPGVVDTLAIGAGRTFDRILDGMTQLYLGSRGDDKALGGLKTNVDEKTRLYKPLQDARPVLTAVGEALPSMALPAVGATANIATTAGKLAIAGGVPKALEYGTAGERAKDAAIGGTAAAVGGTVIPKVLSATGSGITAALSSMLGRVKPEVRALYDEAIARGITVSPAQLSDAKFVKYLQTQLESIPFSGATAAREGQQQSFNRAVSRSFGENSDTVSHAIYTQAKKRIVDQFETLTTRNNLIPTPALVADIGRITNESQRFANSDVQRVVNNLVDDLTNKIDPATGLIPGRAYQSTDSQITKLLKTPGADTPYLVDLQRALRQAMDQSISPADSAAWQTARSQYRNLKAVRDMVARDGADGNISPAALIQSLNSNQAGKESMAMGTRGELGTVAQVGKQFLTAKAPDSGTASRSAITGMLGGAAILNPVPALAGMGATMLTSRGINSVINSRAVADRMVGRGGMTIADLVRATSVPSQTIGANAGLTISDLMGR